MKRPARHWPRARAAAGLEGILAAVDSPAPNVLTAAIAPNPTAVDTNRRELVELVDRLRSDEPVAADGVARVLALLRDGTSPLYTPGPPYVLAVHLERAEHALDW